MSIKLRAEVSMAAAELGVVLLDERTGKYWQLNRSGGLILDKLLAGGSLPDAVAEVASVYRVAPDVVNVDAQELLGRLVSSGLVTS
ncbi:lasso peptide biosynthesis PqqD family chaperone [Actinokineospora sp. NBRC 105648]|uniref:lasso peptide biosynthesis PqqD family chaperone n=1 Tax=Actinokineospora sp. NBRC 105648 TaxID=3032206 RepID=UPI0024A0F811|nr:lasso peptide biosynthesis PqqD family chaperone [Actinokineospora sp. NBRC 105648]GLZ39363.1 hypothetical protein Acsp05_29870 [Actinokineospora sp. NBRC 105648]